MHEGTIDPASISAPPIRGVIDANVFPHRRWMGQIARASERQYLIAIWSPCIISETARLLTWVWLWRNGGDTSEAGRRACAAEAHTWFDEMTAAFHVVEDRPPHEETWTDRPRDVRDVPVWNAAVRGRAHFVVTANLRDGPPVNEQGLRRYRDIVFVHPDEFLTLLDWYESLTGAVLGESGTDTASSVMALPPSLRAFVEEIIIPRGEEVADAE